MNEKFKLIQEALEKIFPELANGEKIHNLKVTEHHQVFERYQFTHDIKIEFTFGYIGESEK